MNHKNHKEELLWSLWVDIQALETKHVTTIPPNPKPDI